MEPLTISLIAATLGAGLGPVGDIVLEHTVVGPMTEGLRAKLRRDREEIKNDVRLREIVQTAFSSLPSAHDEDEVSRYGRNLGLDQMAAPDNSELRQLVAQAALLQTEPKPELIPERLVALLRWPRDRRELLAQFLYGVRQGLAQHPDWGALVAQSNEAETRAFLRQQVASLQQVEQFWQTFLAFHGLVPEGDDEGALRAYLDFVVREYRAISFLFIKPAGRRDRLQTEAELDAVFVPLQVHDPARQQRLQRLMSDRRRREEPEKKEMEPVTINEVLNDHTVFLLCGQPGSGKTTLLRRLATAFAEGSAAAKLGWTGKPLLPILLPLRNFGRFLQDNRKKYTNPAPQSLREFMEDYFREHEVSLPLSFFRRRLDAGGCLLLLDGLDEVADTSLRAEVAQVVSSFIKHYGKNRFGLASRPRGYEEVAHFLPRPTVCDVQPLTPEGRDELVRNLLRQFESNERQHRHEVADLLRDISNKERVDELSRNPLFCTTLVLVYKYRGTSLPERRVDVYQELVRLMLGFWEMHREGVADARELALLDGTGRPFMDENEAVEAKERALIDLADWMQQQGKASVDKADTLAHLAGYFAEREGAEGREPMVWAKGFLQVAHQRSGLFVEAEPETYAFSHKNFLEYLAATALVHRLDTEMVALALAKAEDSWWDEVILLAAAHERLSSPRREFLLRELLGKGHLLLAGRCAVDAGARLPAPLRRQIERQLQAQMVDERRPPKERYAAGEVLDSLGWLPPDLYGWVRCHSAGFDGWAMRYPVTNAQYGLFVAAGGYENPVYWGGEASEAWQWRVEKHSSYRGNEPITAPEYWHTARFGKERQGYPVVGVSWYEAQAYGAWLTALLRRAAGGDVTQAEQALVAELGGQKVDLIRLPEEGEWLAMAGGTLPENRYAWDEQTATNKVEAVVARANVDEAGLGGTSPVAMYPLGRSRPHGLHDLTGNVWEWTLTHYESSGSGRVLRGGSWVSLHDHALVSDRYWHSADDSYPNFGFRLVAPICSGS